MSTHVSFLIAAMSGIPKIQVHPKIEVSIKQERIHFRRFSILETVWLDPNVDWNRKFITPIAIEHCLYFLILTFRYVVMPVLWRHISRDYYVHSVSKLKLHCVAGSWSSWRIDLCLDLSGTFSVVRTPITSITVLTARTRMTGTRKAQRKLVCMLSQQ